MGPTRTGTSPPSIAATHVSSTASNADATATAGDPTSATTPTTASAARTSATTTATVRGAARQAGDWAGDGTPAHRRCTGARCTLVPCVPGDLRVASGCASGCGPRVGSTDTVSRKQQLTCSCYRPHCPIPMAFCPCPRSPFPACVSCNTRSTCLLLCLPLEVVLHVLRVLRVLHIPLLLPLLLPLELPLVCCVFYRVSFLNNLCL